MKKIIIPVILLFIGCSTQINVEKNIKEINTENKILSQYHISKKALIKLKNNYYFYEIVPNGFVIYKLDSNYNIIQSKKINRLIDITKLKSSNDNLIILGYDQEKNQPVILKFDEKLNLKQSIYVGHKFDIPKDISKDNAILLIHYQNGAKLEICKNKCKIYPSKFNIFPKFIKKFNGGYLIVGSIQHPQEDLIILFIKNGKIINSKVYDFSMDDSPIDVKIKKDRAIIKVISQDYMGAQKYITVEIDKNLNIINKEKKLEIKQLPLRFRT